MRFEYCRDAIFCVSDMQIKDYCFYVDMLVRSSETQGIASLLNFDIKQFKKKKINFNQQTLK
jgi:hypothetical protein